MASGIMQQRPFVGEGVDEMREVTGQRQQEAMGRSPSTVGGLTLACSSAILNKKVSTS